MKRIIFLIEFVFIFALSTIGVSAADNVLSAVILEGVDSGYNITLKTDTTAKVKKVVQAPDKVTLVLNGVSSAPEVNVFYKNTPDASSLIVENSSRNDVKVHIKADNIANSNIIFDLPASAPVFVTDSAQNENVAFNVFAAGLVIALIVLIKSVATEKQGDKTLAERGLKDRELELYRNYSRNLNSPVSISTAGTKDYASNVMDRRRTIRSMQSFARK